MISKIFGPVPVRKFAPLQLTQEQLQLMDEMHTYMSNTSAVERVLETMFKSLLYKVEMFPIEITDIDYYYDVLKFSQKMFKAFTPKEELKLADEVTELQPVS